MSEIQIPVQLQAKFEGNTADLENLIRRVGAGSEKAKKQLLGWMGEKYETQLVARFNNKGEVEQVLKKQNKFIGQIEAAYKKSNKAAAGSLTSLRQQVNTLKQQRDAVVKFDAATGRLSKTWSKVDDEIRTVEKQLKRINSPAYQKVSGLLDKIGIKSNSAMGKGLAGAAAGAASMVPHVRAAMMALQSLEPVFQAISGAISAFVARQKQIQGLTLALRGFGASSAEVNEVLKTSKGIAMSYGVSITSIEKGYKRIAPTIRAAGGTISDTGAIMATMAARTATLGLNQEQTGRYMEAFAQVMGKGKLQAEELNQQFAELDGALKPAVADFVRAEYGIADLDVAMAKGEISAAMFAQAMVHASKEMRENMIRDINDIQNRIDTMNIAQIQATIRNMNTFSLEALGRQFGGLGKSIMSIGVTFSQFFLNITSNGDLIASKVLGPIQRAIQIIGVAVDVVLLATNGILKLVDAVHFGIDAVTNWARSFGWIDGIAKKIESFGQGVAGYWRNLKNSVFKSNVATDDAAKSLMLAHKETKEYTIVSGEASGGATKLADASSELAGSMLEQAEAIIATGGKTVELTEAQKKLLESTVKLLETQTKTVNTSARMSEGLGAQVSAIADLATGYDMANMSSDEYAAKLGMTTSLVDSQISSLRSLVKDMAQQEASGIALSATQQDNKEKAEALLATFQEYKTTLTEATEASKAHAAGLEDSSIAYSQFLADVTTVTNAMELAQTVAADQLAVNSKLSQSYVDAATSIRSKKAEIDAQVASYLSYGQSLSDLSMKEREEYDNLIKTSQAMGQKAQQLDDLAVKSASVVNSQGALNQSIKAQVSELANATNAANLDAEAKVRLQQKTEALANIIGTQLKQAQQEYQDLLQKQALSLGALTAEEQKRLDMLPTAITNMEQANEQLKNLATSTTKVKEANEGLVLSEWDKYRQGITDSAEAMDFAVEKGRNLSSSLNNLDSVMTGTSADGYASSINGVKVAAEAVTDAVRDQIQQLNSHIRTLEGAAAAGITLTNAEKDRLEVMREMTAALEEQIAAEENRKRVLEGMAPTVSQQEDMASDLRAEYSSLSKELIAATAELEAMEQANKTGTIEYGRAKTKVDELEGAMSGLKTRIEGTREQFNGLNEEFGDGAYSSGTAASSVNNLWNEVQTLDGQLKIAKDSTDKLSGSNVDLADTADTATGAIQSQTEAIQDQVKATNDLNKSNKQGSSSNKKKEEEKTTFRRVIRLEPWMNEADMKAAGATQEGIDAAMEQRKKDYEKAMEDITTQLEAMRAEQIQQEQDFQDQQSAMLDAALEYRMAAHAKYAAQVEKLSEHASSDFLKSTNEQSAAFDRMADQRMAGLEAMAAQAEQNGDDILVMQYEAEMDALKALGVEYDVQVEKIRVLALQKVKAAAESRDAILKEIEDRKAYLDVLEAETEAVIEGKEKQIEAIDERISAVEDVRDKEIAATDEALQTKLAAIDREMAAADAAMDGKLSDLDAEHNAILRNASAAIAGLQELTPAEKKLAKMREDELKAKAVNMSLTEKERLEAQAALDDMERNRKIAEEQEKIKKEQVRLEKERQKAEEEAAKANAAANEHADKQIESLNKKRTSVLDDIAEAEERISKITEERARQEELAAKAQEDFLAKEEKVREEMMARQRRLHDDLTKEMKSNNADLAMNFESVMTGALEGVDSRASDIHDREMRRIKMQADARAAMLSELPDSPTAPTAPRPPGRFAGGPVSGGFKYTVNELGKEGFMDRAGNMRQINAPAWGTWKAPSAGTVIPAHIWSEINASKGGSHVAPGASFNGNNTTSNAVAIGRALGGLGGRSSDHITNNVTIQSQAPVQAASDMMVEMTRIKRRRYG